MRVLVGVVLLAAGLALWLVVAQRMRQDPTFGPVDPWPRKFGLALPGRLVVAVGMVLAAAGAVLLTTR